MLVSVAVFAAPLPCPIERRTVSTAPPNYGKRASASTCPPPPSGARGRGASSLQLSLLNLEGIQLRRAEPSRAADSIADP